MRPTIPAVASGSEPTVGGSFTNCHSLVNCNRIAFFQAPNLASTGSAIGTSESFPDGVRDTIDIRDTIDFALSIDERVCVQLRHAVCVCDTFCHAFHIYDTFCHAVDVT